MEGLKIIDREKATKEEIEDHFFKAGYSYAMFHLYIGLKKEKLEEGLEKRLMKCLDFLNRSRDK